MNETTYKKDAIVLRQGDSSDCMYYIKWGEVGVFRDYGTPHQKMLAKLSRGDYFGEMGLVDHAPHSATVVVLERGTVLSRIGEDEFARFFEENPNKVDAIIRRLSHKLRQTTKDYLELCHHVSKSVGQDTYDVDETSNYNFEQNVPPQAVQDEPEMDLDEAPEVDLHDAPEEAVSHETYRKGDVIFREGSYGETMYEITSGKVGVYASYGTDHERLLAAFGEGETFGEMGLIEYRPRTATAVVLEDGTDVKELNADGLKEYLLTKPEKVLSLMRQLSARLRETNRRYEEARRTVNEAIEAEAVGARRNKSLRSRLSAMIRRVR